MPIAGAISVPRGSVQHVFSPPADQNPALNRAASGRDAGLKTLCVEGRANPLHLIDRGDHMSVIKSAD